MLKEPSPIDELARNDPATQAESSASSNMAS
jgi:hypothetical protein